jgi:hypothetical protein
MFWISRTLDSTCGAKQLVTVHHNTNFRAQLEGAPHLVLIQNEFVLEDLADRQCLLKQLEHTTIWGHPHDKSFVSMKVPPA